MFYTRGQAPLSAYVDRGSVRIGETLRNRYVQNFQAADELQAQLDLLNSTDFEGDLRLKNELERNTRDRLDQLATRGDYENLALAVNKTNRDFQRQYSPIKQNYDAYQAYKADVQKKYEEGFIDAETLKGALAMSSHGYKGLQLDAEGNVDQSSYFTGATLVKDVNIAELVDEAVKDMMPDKDVQDITRVNGAMLVRTKDGTEYIDESRVEDIYNEVINRPDVTAALNQKARLRTYNLSAEDKMGMVTTDIDANKKQIQQLQQEVNSNKYSPQQKTAMHAKMAQLQSKINEMENLDATNIDGYVRNRTIQGILDPIEQSVLAKNVYSQVEQVYEEDFNKVYMAQLESDLAEQRAIRKEQRELDTGMISYRGDALEFAAPYDFDEYADSLDSTDEQIKQLEAAANDTANSAQTRQNAQAQILTLRNNQQAQVAGLAAIARGIQKEGEVYIDPNTDFTNPYFYETLSDDAREAISDALEDEDSPYNYKRPQEVDYLTAGSKEFNQFEKDFKNAFPVLPADWKGYIVPAEGNVDISGAPTDNFGQQDLAGAKIADVAVTTGGVAGTASEGEYIALTLSGGEDGKFDGQRVIVPMDAIESSTVSAFKNSPHYTLTKRMNQARLSKSSMVPMNASMRVMRAADGKQFEDTVPVEVYLYPDAQLGDQVSLRYQGADGSMVNTDRMSIEELTNDREFGLGSEHILSFSM